ALEARSIKAPGEARVDVRRTIESRSGGTAQVCHPRAKCPFQFGKRDGQAFLSERAGARDLLDQAATQHQPCGQVPEALAVRQRTCRPSGARDVFRTVTQPSRAGLSSSAPLAFNLRSFSSLVQLSVRRIQISL